MEIKFHVSNGKWVRGGDEVEPEGGEGVRIGSRGGKGGTDSHYSSEATVESAPARDTTRGCPRLPFHSQQTHVLAGTLPAPHRSCSDTTAMRGLSQQARRREA